MNTPLISLDKIAVNLGKQQILENITFSLYPKQIVTLIGPNGAGKTTLVKVALGLLKPSAGRVKVQPGLRIGYMPQRIHFNSSLPLTSFRFLSLTRASKQDDIDRTLAEVGALGVREKPLTGLSGGEIQRVLLAKALLNEPDLLVLDEPVQGVDIMGQSEIYELIAKIQEERGCGILMISHDLHLVMASTDEVICLNRHICCQGHPDKVAQDPAFVELFGKTVVSGVAPYTHKHDHKHE